MPDESTRKRDHSRETGEAREQAGRETEAESVAPAQTETVLGSGEVMDTVGTSSVFL